jgi:hypothetical protein
MNDPKESLRRYFLMSEQASTVAIDRIEVLVETLREVVPGFKDEYLKQSKLQGERRAEQAKSTGDPSPHRADELVQMFQKALGH